MVKAGFFVKFYTLSFFRLVKKFSFIYLEIFKFVDDPGAYYFFGYSDLANQDTMAALSGGDFKPIPGLNVDGDMGSKFTAFSHHTLLVLTFTMTLEWPRFGHFVWKNSVQLFNACYKYFSESLEIMKGLWHDAVGSIRVNNCFISNP